MKRKNFVGNGLRTGKVLRLRSCLVLLGVVYCIFCLGCGRKAATALGRIREVTVASDWWPQVEPTVRQILQDTVFTPQPEPRFLLRVFSAKQFENYRLLRTVFLIGTSVDTVLKVVLGAKLDSLPETGYGLFRIPNAWADNQQLVVFVAKHESLLVRGLEAYSLRIRNTFWDIALRNVERAVYFRGRDQKKTDALTERYGFTLDIPREWYLKEDHADSGFIYLFAHYPDRGVFVFWRDSVRELVPELLVGLRETLVTRYYDGDRIEPNYIKAETIAFLGQPAVRLQGVWQNDKGAMGGPFVSYCFNHEGRFFLVDGQVFLPGKPKLDQLLQVEVIIRSFTPQ